METFFRDVVCSVVVVADTQPGRTNCSLLNPLFLSVAKKVVQYADEPTVTT